MEEVRSIYNTLSDYVLNPIVLEAVTGVLVAGTLACAYFSGKLLRKIAKENREIEEAERRNLNDGRFLNL